MNKSHSSFSLVFLGTILLLSSSFAATKAWNVPTGDWETPESWSAVGVPVPGDIANLRNGGTATISSAVADVSRVSLGGDSQTSLIVETGGSLTVTGNNLTRISDAADRTGVLTLDGGDLTATGVVYLGLGANATAAVNVAKGGTLATSNGLFLSSANAGHTGMTATVNIGGAITADAAGWIAAATMTGLAGEDLSNINTVNFNHTSDRYAFTQGESSGDAVRINGATAVNIKAGVTVFSGTSTYSRGTLISSGAVLLANSEDESAVSSSTGSGAVEVSGGGVLGGIGHILGDTEISGTLKPGDYDYERAIPLHGVLKFGGDLTLNDGSFTEIALDGITRGVGYDAIDVAGNLDLNGTLVLNLLDGFAIDPDETLEFTLFDVAGTFSGTFDVFTLPSSWEGTALEWNTDLLSTTGVLSVTAVPEPGVSVLIGAAAALFLSRRRRITGGRF